MTTIVAIQCDGFAVIGTDSRISSLDEDGYAYQYGTMGSGQTKIAVNGKYLIGAAGDVRAINILHHVFQPPAPAPSLRGKRLDSFITAKFISSLKSCFDEHGITHCGKDNQKTQQDSSIIAVVNGSVYVIDTDFSWYTDASGVYAIGTGGQIALGALHALQVKQKLSISQAKRNCIKALTAAAKYDPYTGSPFQTFVQEANNGRK